MGSSKYKPQRKEMRDLIPLWQLWLRDKKTCGICGNYVPRRQASRDHIVPLSLGGPNTVENIQLAHIKCNTEKE